MAHLVAVAITEGVPLFELAVPCEVFGIDRPELADPWYALRLCAEEPGVTRTAAGLVADTAHDLRGLLAADTVVVPAGKSAHDHPAPALVEAVREAHACGARIVSICSGAFVVAAAGLLDGRRATCHWMHAERFVRQFPNVVVDPSVLYVDEGDVLTSAGTAAGLDLCLHIVRLDHGVQVANALARRLVIAPHRAGGQAQYVQSPVAAHDHGLAPVLDWALAHLDDPLTVRILAGRAAMSHRTFARHFLAATGTSPLRWLLAQRVRRAQELLETTNEPVGRIAQLAGFGSAANLRQHFSRALGTSPQAYRAAFRS